ncbi:MAG TPA: hypothetical protein VEF89_30555 [Solirubrobacteraceae bacterium]|nr:hypothetical protein [Solirubrobacteraceae bacterium]
MVPFDEIEVTFPACTCARHVGLYGIRTRVCALGVSVEASTTLSSITAGRK